MKPVCLLCFLFFSFQLIAQTPKTISFQGVLTDQDGEALPDDTYQLSLSLYDTATGGNALWEEMQMVFTNKGVFSTILGSTNPLDLNFNRSYWLGIRVDGGSELEPRTALTSVPYALGKPGLTEPGKNLTVLNDQADSTHILYADGRSYQSDVALFEKGIFLRAQGDSALYMVPGDGWFYMGPDSTLNTNRNFHDLPFISFCVRLFVKELHTRIISARDIISLSKVQPAIRGNSEEDNGIEGFTESPDHAGIKGHSENGVGIGVLGMSSSRPGVLGQSVDNPGVVGQSQNVSGVFANSTLNYGITANGGMGAALLRGDVSISNMGRLLIDNVEPANSDRILVWADDKYVKWRPASDISSGGFDGLLVGKPLVITTQFGDTTTIIEPDGTSLHHGIETFTNDVVIVSDPESTLQTGLFLRTPDGGINGYLGEGEQFLLTENTEARLNTNIGKDVAVYGFSEPGHYAGGFVGDVLIQDGQLIMKGFGGDTVFMVQEDGTSLHAGVETFTDDVILTAPSGKGLKLIDESGETIAGFGREDLDTGERIGVFGKAENEGDLAAAFVGDVNIQDGEFLIQNAEGDTLFLLLKDGRSLHAGREAYRAGIDLGPGQGSGSTSSALFFTEDNNIGGVLGFNDGSQRTEVLCFGRSASDWASFNQGNCGNQGPSIWYDDNSIQRCSLDPNADPVAGYLFDCDGNLRVTGMIMGGVKNFLIDHPLDPENKTLRHYSVESDQMQTVYNGNAVLDENGEAVVQMPDWFEALNMNFSYQLTCIGGFANVYIAEKIEDNRFRIAGGFKGLEVSWQVTGVRHDPVAEEYRMPVVEEKRVSDRSRQLRELRPPVVEGK